MGRSGKKGISVGTVLALALSASVLVCMLVIFSTLGGELDLTRLSVSTGEETSSGVQPVQSAAPMQTLAAAVTTASPDMPTGSLTITAGGSFCLESGVRKSGYYSDVKAYDFTDILSLVSGNLRGDLSLVTLENLVDESARVSDLIAPQAVLPALKDAGLTGVSLGFSKALDKGSATLDGTVSAAQRAGLQVWGAYASETPRLMTVNGVRIALLAYTDTVSSSGAKKRKADTSGLLLPSTDRAAQDIADARAAGAQAVIVSVFWGGSGKSAVTGTQRSTAQALAQAGADVILGTGTRTVQPACWLEGEDGHSTLCFYSLGTLVSDDRSNSQVAGVLAQLTLQAEPDGGVAISEIACTPTYVWRYKQDGTYRYRVVASSQDAPAGMESSQQDAMRRALSTTQTALGTEVDLKWQ